MSPKFTLINVNAAESIFLKKVAERATEIITTKKFLVKLGHCVTVVGKEMKVDIPEDIALLKATVIVNHITANVTTKSDCRGAYAQTVQADGQRKTNEIIFRHDWIEYVTNTDNKVTEHTQEYRHNFALAVIKFIHEFGHCCTREIIEFAIKRGGQLPPSTKSQATQLTTTPVKCGSKVVTYKRNKRNVYEVIGDMGFLVEETLFGSRIYAQMSSKSKFLIKRLVVEKYFPTLPKTGSCIRYIVNMQTMDRLETDITMSAEPDVDTYLIPDTMLTALPIPPEPKPPGGTKRKNCTAVDGGNVQKMQKITTDGDDDQAPMDATAKEAPNESSFCDDYHGDGDIETAYGSEDEEGSEADDSDMEEDSEADGSDMDEDSEADGSDMDEDSETHCSEAANQYSSAADGTGLKTGVDGNTANGEKKKKKKKAGGASAVEVKPDDDFTKY